MISLDDNDLILFASGQLEDASKMEDISKNILESEDYKEQYLFLLNIKQREEQMLLKMTGQKNKTRKTFYSPDILLYEKQNNLKSTKEESFAFDILSKDIQVKEDKLKLRSEENNSLPALQISKKTIPYLYLVRENKNKEHLSLYLEKDIPFLQILEEDRIYYQADYKKGKRIKIENHSNLYTIILEHKLRFSFKIVKV